jgi:hypothetical protein
MKGSDFVKKLNEVLQVQLPEDVIKKLDEVELPDEVQTKFADVFISRERAKNDDSIIEHIVKEERKKIFKVVDEKIKPLLEFLPEENRNIINNEYQTYTKMDMLKPGFAKAFESTKGKVSEDVRKVEDEWSAKLKKSQEDHQKELELQQSRFKEAELDNHLKYKLQNYTFADSFLPIKDALIKTAIIDLKSKPYKLALENGSVAVREEKDGTLRDVFEGENKVTIDKLLDGFVANFIRKNNAGEGEAPKEEPGKSRTTEPTGKESLQDLMWKQAGK